MIAFGFVFWVLSALVFLTLGLLELLCGCNYPFALFSS